MRKTTALALTLTALLAVAQPAFAAKSQPARSRSTVTAGQHEGAIVSAIKKFVKQFFGAISNSEQISLPKP